MKNYYRILTIAGYFTLMFYGVGLGLCNPVAAVPLPIWTLDNFGARDYILRYIP